MLYNEAFELRIPTIFMHARSRQIVELIFGFFFCSYAWMISNADGFAHSQFCRKSYSPTIWKMKSTQMGYLFLICLLLVVNLFVTTIHATGCNEASEKGLLKNIFFENTKKFKQTNKNIHILFQSIQKAKTTIRNTWRWWSYQRTIGTTKSMHCT